MICKNVLYEVVRLLLFTRTGVHFAAVENALIGEPVCLGRRHFDAGGKLDEEEVVKVLQGEPVRVHDDDAGEVCEEKCVELLVGGAVVEVLHARLQRGEVSQEAALVLPCL